jgi:hypothetical protein
MALGLRLLEVPNWRLLAQDDQEGVIDFRARALTCGPWRQGSLVSHPSGHPLEAYLWRAVVTQQGMEAQFGEFCTLEMVPSHGMTRGEAQLPTLGATWQG